jgi:transketolase C-terminal domain/subunit
MLATFTTPNHRALYPIRMLVAQTHANVKIGAAYAGLLTGLTGKTHHDVQDIAIMRAMPDMTVVAPTDAIEGEAIIRWATEYEGPVYVRLAPGWMSVSRQQVELDQIDIFRLQSETLGITLNS